MILSFNHKRPVPITEIFSQFQIQIFPIFSVNFHFHPIFFIARNRQLRGGACNHVASSRLPPPPPHTTHNTHTPDLSLNRSSSHTHRYCTRVQQPRILQCFSLSSLSALIDPRLTVFKIGQRRYIILTELFGVSVPKINSHLGLGFFFFFPLVSITLHRRSVGAVSGALMGAQSFF